MARRLTYPAWKLSVQQRALPEPPGRTPSGRKRACSQSARSISPFTTYNTNHNGLLATSVHLRLPYFFDLLPFPFHPFKGHIAISYNSLMPDAFFGTPLNELNTPFPLGLGVVVAGVYPGGGEGGLAPPPPPKLTPAGVN